MSLKKGIIKILYYSRHKHDGNFFLNIRQMLGFTPKHMGFYWDAFGLKNPKQKDKRKQKIEFQRLEFLGDAILGAVISEYLYKLYPNEDEGFLTQMRSKIVSRKMLHLLGVQVGLKSLMQLENRRGKIGHSHIGDTLEALIGAVFLDKGYDTARSFIELKILKPHIKPEQLIKQIQSYKSHLYEWCQKNKKSLSFNLGNRTGSDHNPTFEVHVCIDGEVWSHAKGKSIRIAEETAAEEAYKLLKQNKTSST